MACSLQIDQVFGQQPDASGTPATLVVRGSVSSSCLQVRGRLDLPGALSALAIVSGGQFEIQLLRDTHFQSGEVVCGPNPNRTILVDCLDGDTCQTDVRLDDLSCGDEPPCLLAFAAPNPITAVPDPVEPQNPGFITITGTVANCAEVEVRFHYTTSSNPVHTDWKTATIDGNTWSVTFQRNADYLKDLLCGASIDVEARCAATPDCAITATMTIPCGDAVHCPDATLSARITRDCTQGRRRVIFTVELANLQPDTAVTGSIHTGDTSAVNEVEIPVAYAPDTAGDWTAVGSGGARREFDHYYPEGTFAPVFLQWTGQCAEAIALGEITGPDGDPLDDLSVARCDCPPAEVVLTVCRVSDDSYACGDPLPAGGCSTVSEAELDDPAGLPPGTYLVEAATDPPGQAQGVSWSLDGQLAAPLGDGRLCVPLAEGASRDASASVTLSADCVPSRGVQLRGAGGDNGNGDGGNGGNGGNGGDGCLVNWCLIWLWINFGVSIAAGIAVIVTACVLFNPAGLTSAFWAGVVVSAILIVGSIISFIVWAAVCGRLRMLCGALVWVHDLLLLLAAFTGIGALILALLGQPPCAIGFVIDFAYYGVLAAITEVVIRLLNCPLGQNGLVGAAIAVINWVGQQLGIGN